MHHNFLIHSSAEERLGISLFLDLMNTAAMNIIKGWRKRVLEKPRIACHFVAKVEQCNGNSLVFTRMVDCFHSRLASIVPVSSSGLTGWLLVPGSVAK